MVSFLTVLTVKSDGAASSWDVEWSGPMLLMDSFISVCVHCVRADMRSGQVCVCVCVCVSLSLCVSLFLFVGFCFWRQFLCVTALAGLELTL